MKIGNLLFRVNAAFVAYCLFCKAVKMNRVDDTLEQDPMIMWLAIGLGNVLLYLALFSPKHD